MINSAHVLRPHGGSGYVTNLKLWLCHKLELWFPNSRKNGLLNGKNRKSVGCVLAKLQWLVETCPIINVLRYVVSFQTYT